MNGIFTRRNLYIDTYTHTMRITFEDQGRDWGDISTSQGKVWYRFFPHSPQKESILTLPHPWALVAITVRQYIPVFPFFTHPICGCYGSPSK